MTFCSIALILHDMISLINHLNIDTFPCDTYLHLHIYLSICLLSSLLWRKPLDIYEWRVLDIHHMVKRQFSR